jgi:hypothetical protein
MPVRVRGCMRACVCAMGHVWVGCLILRETVAQVARWRAAVAGVCCLSMSLHLPQRICQVWHGSFLMCETTYVAAVMLWCLPSAADAGREKWLCFTLVLAAV